MTNDSFVNAIPIVVPSDGATVTMPGVLNTGFGVDIDAGWYTVYRDAWWTYTPGSFGEILIDVDQSTPGPQGVRIDVWYGGPGVNDLQGSTDNQVVFDDTGTGTVDFSNRSERLWVRVSTLDDVDVTYVLRLTGPESAGDGSVMRGVCAITVGVSGVEGDPPVFLDLTGTAAMSLDLSGAATYRSTALADGIGTAYPASLITATITAETPVDGFAVPGLKPAFSVDIVTTQRDLDAVVQYSTSPTFSAPVSITVPIMTGQAVIHETLRSVNPLVDGTTYYWRAYVGNAYDRTAYTATRSFTVSTLDGDGAIGVRWLVSNFTTAVPHLWFAHPARTSPGLTVIAHGTGFGPTAATVSVNGIPATVTSFNPTIPSADAYTAQRAIIPGVGLADPAHQTVMFTVPAVDPPGGVLTIDGS